MNRWLVSLLVSRCRPRRSIDLLLRANLAPNDKAKRAWRDWLRVRSVEDATWPEARLLAPLARRIATLDPGSPLRPRLEGLAKAHWTGTQLIIRNSASALDALSDAGIDYLLLKGAAHYAEGVAPATRRIMGDVDILVSPEAIAMANDRLRESGWSPKLGESSEVVHDERIPSSNYQKGEFGSVDLHRRAFHFSRRDLERDAELWKNARMAKLMGRSVLVPSVADSIVISIAHGVRGGEGDWAIDVDYRIRADNIDWDRVACIADQRGLVPTILSGLVYLKTLGTPVPSSLLTSLRRARPTLGEYLKYFDETLMRETRDIVPSRLANGAHRVANALLPRDRYQYRW